MQEEVVPAVTSDPPGTVMQSHVVVSAEQDATIDIGAALILVPFIDVVGFAV